LTILTFKIITFKHPLLFYSHITQKYAYPLPGPIKMSRNIPFASGRMGIAFHHRTSEKNTKKKSVSQNWTEKYSVKFAWDKCGKVLTTTLRVEQRKWKMVKVSAGKIS